LSPLSEEHLSDIRDTSTVTSRVSNYSDDESIPPPPRSRPGSPRLDQQPQGSPIPRRNAMVSNFLNLSDFDGSLVSAQVQPVSLIPEVEAVLLPDEIAMSESEGANEDDIDGRVMLDGLDQENPTGLLFSYDGTVEELIPDVNHDGATIDILSSSDFRQESNDANNRMIIVDEDHDMVDIEVPRVSEFIDKPGRTIEDIDVNDVHMNSLMKIIDDSLNLPDASVNIENNNLDKCIVDGSEIKESNSGRLLTTNSSKNPAVAEDLPPIRDKISAYETLISKKKSFDGGSNPTFVRSHPKRQSNVDSFRSSSPKDFHKIGFGSSVPKNNVLTISPKIPIISPTRRHKD